MLNGAAVALGAVAVGLAAQLVLRIRDRRHRHLQRDAHLPERGGHGRRLRRAGGAIADADRLPVKRG